MFDIQILKSWKKIDLLGYGVIGNTSVFGTVVLGSSPGSPAFLRRTL